jgi:hypothetical protein
MSASIHRIPSSNKVIERRSGDAVINKYIPSQTPTSLYACFSWVLVEEYNLSAHRIGVSSNRRGIGLELEKLKRGRCTYTRLLDHCFPNRWLEI